MPQARGLYLRVGTLVVIGVMLAVGFILFLTATRFGTTSVTYETYSRESVQGLDVGAAVRYRGVAIGRVSEIGLVSAEYRRQGGNAFASAFQLVLIRFTVDTQKIGETASIEDAVRLGLRVRIASQGLTGVSYLELDFVNPEYYPPREVPWTPRYSYIPSIPSTVAQVQNAAEQLLRKLEGVDLQGLIENVLGLAADLRKQTQNGDLAMALREAAGLLQTLHSAAADANLPEIAGEVRGAATEAQKLLANPDLRQTLANLAATTAELRRLTGRLPNTLNTLDGTLRSARSASTDLQSELAPILRDLRATVSNLRDTSEALRRNPSQLLFGSPPPPPSGR